MCVWLHVAGGRTQSARRRAVCSAQTPTRWRGLVGGKAAPGVWESVRSVRGRRPVEVERDG
eukprot:1970946-Prymnesium_polylepis.1